MGEKTKCCTKCSGEFPATTEFFYVNNKRTGALTSRCCRCLCDDMYERANGHCVGSRDFFDDIPGERWLFIDYVHGPQRYFISDMGRAKSVRRGEDESAGKLLSTDFDDRPRKGGYLRVALLHNGKHIHYSVHRLVAEAFIGPVAEHKLVHHIDGDKANNTATNLEIVTRLEHAKLHSELWVKTNLGEKNPQRILSERDIPKIRALLNDGVMTLKEIGNMFGVGKSAIANIKYGLTWSHVK